MADFTAEGAAMFFGPAPQQQILTNPASAPFTPFGAYALLGEQAIVKQSAQDFLGRPVSTLLPSNGANPAEPYPDHMVAGTMPPLMPYQPYVLFTAPNLADLPPVWSFYNRPFPTLAGS